MIVVLQVAIKRCGAGSLASAPAWGDDTPSFKYLFNFHLIPSFVERGLTQETLGRGAQASMRVIWQASNDYCMHFVPYIERGNVVFSACQTAA